MTQRLFRTEVQLELVRSQNAKAAEAAIDTEWAAQLATPRVPSAEVAALKSEVNELIARNGGGTDAARAADLEQVARVQEHLFKSEVGPELVRAVHRKLVDAATTVEQTQLMAQRLFRTEVQLELVRSQNAKAAEAAIDTEWAAQLATPRVPSAEVAALKSEVNELIARNGGGTDAARAADLEQVARVQEHLFKSEVGPELVRAVHRKLVDAA